MRAGERSGETFAGRPCPAGHMERYTGDGSCAVCRRVRSSDRAKRQPKRLRFCACGNQIRSRHVKKFDSCYPCRWTKDVRREYERNHRGYGRNTLRRLGIVGEKAALILSSPVCGLCGRTDRRLVTDHDHVTNKFRGRLCSPCNQALGILGDTIEGLQRAVDYLRGYKPS
jgi:hypothetical protein